MNGPNYRAHPDCVGIDEIFIKVVPRFKTSKLSGDEWRISALVTIKRKGTVLFERAFSSMGCATRYLAYVVEVELVENAKVERGIYGHYPDECAQPGCDKKPVNHYRIKKLYEHGHGPLPDEGSEERRAFCEGHSHRGDSDMEDNDENYELVQGSGYSTLDPSSVSPAQFGGVIDVR